MTYIPRNLGLAHWQPSSRVPEMAIVIYTHWMQQPPFNLRKVSNIIPTTLMSIIAELPVLHLKSCSTPVAQYSTRTRDNAEADDEREAVPKTMQLDVVSKPELHHGTRGQRKHCSRHESRQHGGLRRQPFGC